MAAIASWYIRADTVGAWRSAAQKLALTAEDVASGLADALERFASLEAACRATAALGSQLEKLKPANTGLQAERRRMRAALDTAAADGSAQVAAAKVQAVASIEAVGAQHQAVIREIGERMDQTIETFARLQRQAAQLAKYVQWARTLANPQAEPWRDVAPETWSALRWHLARWAETARVNSMMALPDDVMRLSRGSTD